MLSRASLTIVLALLAGVTQAGTVFETVTRDLGGNRGETLMTTHAQGGQMRVKAGDRDGYALFKSDALYVINDKDRNYVVLDKASVKKMADTINPALKQLQEQLAQMPPEQRAQMERMLGNKLPTTKTTAQEVRKTTRTGTVAGYACTYVEVLEDGVLQDEFCVVAPGTLKGGDELMAAAAKMSALTQEIFRDLDAPWLRQSIDRQTESYAKIGGLPVLSRHFADGKPVSETTLKSIRTEALPAATFDVPAGYARKDLLTQR